MERFAAAIFALLAACSASDATPSPDSGPIVLPDAGFSGACAEHFGVGLSSGFGRIDGVVWSVVRPDETSCALANDDHAVVQVMMQGAIYRMVVNVMSDRAGQDPRVHYAIRTRALPEPAYEDGWHLGVTLDYPNMFDVHSSDMVPAELDVLVDRIDAELNPGDPVSIYATNESGGTSAHLIHRNGNLHDGAIAIAPTSTTTKFMMFRFANQSF